MAMTLWSFHEREFLSRLDRFAVDDRRPLQCLLPTLLKGSSTFGLSHDGTPFAWPAMLDNSFGVVSQARGRSLCRIRLPRCDLTAFPDSTSGRPVVCCEVRDCSVPRRKRSIRDRLHCASASHWDSTRISTSRLCVRPMFHSLNFW